ncbi:glycoside hydrolase family 71 protein [Xylaria sp. CBS 124048]|nr:glycoside hydrolase family 71 protein [Xylaria sp. CBS 124048]
MIIMHHVLIPVLALLIASHSLRGAADIKPAVVAGFDAFALNVGLFDHADTRHDFKLFLSFDFYQTGDITHMRHCTRKLRIGHLTYVTATQIFRSASSYSGGGIGTGTWRNFKTANNVYLIPNPEADGDYYSQPSTFFQSWRDAPAAIKLFIEAVGAGGKTYIMGLSALQYKHCCGHSWCREGDATLTERVNQILQLSPEVTEVITWPLHRSSWPETVTEKILQYGDTAANPHTGWQPPISSFIAAFKGGASGMSSMIRPNGAAQLVAVGLNYNSIEGLNTGAQLLERLGEDGNPANGFCNFNYHVVGLK